MNKSFFILVLVVLLAVSSVVSARSSFINVYFYGSTNKHIQKCFEIDADGVLLRDSIRLDSISEKIRPALGVSQGDFLVGADQNTEDFQKYGEIAYKTVDLEGKKTTLYTFQPSGNQVHSFASDIVGKIWKVSNNINTKKIADTSYKKVVLPDGTKRLMMMHKMTNGNSRWVGFHEGTIYQLEGVNIVRKIGEANWRKVIISETEVVLFMSKKIEKNAEWIGAYNGKYYISQ